MQWHRMGLCALALLLALAPPTLQQPSEPVDCSSLNNDRPEPTSAVVGYDEHAGFDSGPETTSSPTARSRNNEAMEPVSLECRDPREERAGGELPKRRVPTSPAERNDPPTDYPPPREQFRVLRRQRGAHRRLYRRLRYYFWQLCVILLAANYFVLSASGLAVLLPTVFAMPLHSLSLPWVQALEDYEFGSRMTLGHVVAAVTFIFCWALLDRAFKYLVLNEVALERIRPDMDTRRTRAVLIFVTGLLVFGDVSLFFAGVTRSNSINPSGGVFSGLLVTLLHLSLMLGAAYLSAEDDPENWTEEDDR